MVCHLLVMLIFLMAFMAQEPTSSDPSQLANRAAMAGHTFQISGERLAALELAEAQLVYRRDQDLGDLVDGGPKDEACRSLAIAAAEMDDLRLIAPDSERRAERARDVLQRTLGAFCEKRSRQ